jgi:hypothetical protein
MSHIISCKLHLDPIDTLLIWTSHNSAIINQNIDFIDLGIDKGCSGADGGLGCEIEGDEGSGDGWILRADGGDQGCDFGFCAAGEEEGGGETGGEREGCFGAYSTYSRAGNDNLISLVCEFVS